MRKIILHSFLWQLKDITKNLNIIKEQNFNVIQISPINEIKEGSEWWNFYQPLSFSIGNKTGTKEDLIELCKEAKKLGIDICADIVLRHCATDDGQLIPSKAVDEKLRNNPKFWTNSKNTVDYNNRYAVTHGAFGLPILDYDNKELQDIYIKYLQELKDCGIKSMRIDMGKHFSLPSEGSNFWERVFGKYNDMFNYAECLESSKELLDQYTPFINVLTDGTASDRSKMVIYIMSHDTELTFGYTKHMDDNMIIKEWNYLLKEYKESHVLFYARELSDLWKSEEIRKINFKGGI